jgi:hypothetical protein
MSSRKALLALGVGGVAGLSAAAMLFRNSGSPKYPVSAGSCGATAFDNLADSYDGRIDKEEKALKLDKLRKKVPHAEHEQNSDEEFWRSRRFNDSGLLHSDS